MELSRRDARRNRARILETAHDLLAREGVPLSMRRVAREAGLGVGTVYRHFPAREDLLDAVLADAFETAVAIGERALANDDAWDGFCGYLEDTLVLSSSRRGLRDIITSEQHGRARAAVMRARLREIVTELVERAQAQGSLRGDFTRSDVTLVYFGCDRVSEVGGDVAPEIWRRQLGFVLDGLRAGAATPLPYPALTDEQLRRVGRRDGGRAVEP